MLVLNERIITHRQTSVQDAEFLDGPTCTMFTLFPHRRLTNTPQIYADRSHCRASRQPAKRITAADRYPSDRGVGSSLPGQLQWRRTHQRPAINAPRIAGARSGILITVDSFPVPLGFSVIVNGRRRSKRRDFKRHRACSTAQSFPPCAIWCLHLDVPMHNRQRDLVAS